MKARLAILVFAFVAGLAAIVAMQARWQLDGASDQRLVRFMRRYDRGDGYRRLPVRGRVIDRFGETLAESAGRSVWARDYPGGEPFAHPVGYFNRSYGITGLERALDAELSTGREVKLTLDADLQRRAYELLSGRAGAVVALEPASGRIRALASAPAFDPSDPGGAYLVAGAPLVNRALAGLYPPGSVFKLFIAASALSRGLDPVFSCPAGGYLPAPGAAPIRDSEAAAAERAGRRWKGWGRLGMREALVHSSNTYFAQLGVALGPEAFNEDALKSCLRDSFTLAASGDGALESAPCSLPDVASAPELAQIGIGQGRLQLTPLAVAMLTAAIANDGVVAAPRLVAGDEPRIASRPFSRRAAAEVKGFMRAAAERGTAARCRVPGLAVCAKTGTAQSGAGADHSWFTCFAPAERPRLVVTVVVENGGFGADAALPIARELLVCAFR